MLQVLQLDFSKVDRASVVDLHLIGVNQIFGGVSRLAARPRLCSSDQRLETAFGQVPPTRRPRVGCVKWRESGL
jgi:hypothetical protein